MEIGLGQMGMSTQDFDNITVAEFSSKQRGFMELERHRDRQEWIRTITLINIQLPKGKKIDPETLFKEKKKVELMTKEQFESLNKKWSSYVPREPKLPVPRRY